MGLTRHRTLARPALLKATDTHALTAEYAVSYPCEDKAGDIVEAAGLDPAVHKALRGWVGLEHYRWTPDGADWVLPGPKDDHLSPVEVGSAFGPDGGYSLTVKAMPEGNVAFGKTWFNGKTRLGYQTFGLVRDGTLTGTSVEFTLTPGQYTPRGPSPLEDRPAYHVRKCSLIGWVHCATPVNPGALLLKSLPPWAEQARRVVTTGRVGAEAAHPLILKSLARFLPGKSTTVTSGYERKAMPDDLTAAYTPDDAAPIDVDTPAAGGSTPTVQALYQLAQGLQDMKAQVEEMLSGSEHVKGKKFAAKLLADLDGTVEDATEMAAKIEAELGQKDDAAEPDAEPAEPEPDIADDDTEPDEDEGGVLKCIVRRPAVFKAIRRFTLAEVRKAKPAEPMPVPDDQDTPEARAEYERELRAYRRAQRKHGSY